MGGPKKSKSSKGGVHLFWMPGRKSRKHKHEQQNHHRQQNTEARGISRSRQNSISSDMMSGDSSNPHHGGDLKFDPICTPTSSAASKQDKSVQSEATVVVEHQSKPTPLKELPSIVVTETTSRDSTDQTNENQGTDGAMKLKAEPKPNGNMDKLDGVWLPNDEKHKVEEEPAEKEECAVTCLYYTMQCCDCTIL